MCKGKFVKTGRHTQHREEVTSASTTITALPATSTANVTNGARLPFEKKFTTIVPPSLTRPLVEKFDMELAVTKEMVPSCQAMVYYVRKDKEVVADSVKFDVEGRLENQVKSGP